MRTCHLTEVIRGRLFGVLFCFCFFKLWVFSKMLPGKEMFWYMVNEALHQRYFLSANSYNKNCQEWRIIWNTCFLK